MVGFFADGGFDCGEEDELRERLRDGEEVSSSCLRLLEISGGRVGPIVGIFVSSEIVFSC